MLYGCNIHEEDHAQHKLCNCCVFKGNIYMFLVSQVCGLVKTFNIHHRHHKCNKCQTLHDTELFPVHYTFSDLDVISMSQQCLAVLTENCMSLSDEVETW